MATSLNERERSLATSREGIGTGLMRTEPRWGLTGGMMQSPFAMMRRMMDDMDRLFESFGFGSRLTPFSSFGFAPWTNGDRGIIEWTPAVEVVEKDDKLIVRAELPGVSRDDVNVNITDDVLTIEGERKHEAEDQGDGYYRSERSYGRFMRSIPLPEGVDGEKAEARFKDGVLEVTLPAPKRERKRGRKIAVR